MKRILKLYVSILLVLTLFPLSVFVFYKNDSDKFYVKNTDNNKTLKLSQKEYVLGALCCEMPPTFHKEALKAQAVAIFTNAVREKELNQLTEISIKNLKGYTDRETLKEKWGKNFSYYYDKMSEAVDEVLGKVITYQNAPILAAYHSMSSGKTESAENVWGEKVNYLTPVLSEGDTFAADYKIEKFISINEVREKLSESFPETYLPELDTLLFTDITRSDSKTVLSLVVGDKNVTGKQIREIFSLRSAAFEIEVMENEIKFACYGYGHGVGLSQYGADFMARQGSSYEQILNHYYSQTKLMKLE